ncbi:MAG: HD-GYP domain-containing protein [Gaiellaceae bacterium]
MLAAISYALEERDQTHGHGARVASLAESLATCLGWSEERLAALRLGATLHDIGKVSVRPETLRKSEPLTQREQAEIRSHPGAGAVLISELRWARPALPYVLCHHERWDGLGYPSRLRGDAIPLGARILAVVDAFDAMISPRAYRPPLTIEQAHGELAAGAGTQFDGVLVELFLALRAERLAA